MALVNVPGAVARLGASLDLSWVVGVNMAHERHLEWGTQVIWTYGPLGYLVLPGYFYFDTWLTSVIALLLLHLLFFATLALFMLDLGSPPWHWLLIGLLFLTPLYFVPSLEPWSYIVTLALLLHLSAAGRWRHPELFAVVAGLLLAFLTLFKVSAIVAGVALTLCYVPVALWFGRRRSVVAFLISSVCAFLLLWLAVGGSLAAIGPYFQTQYELVAAFAGAMSLLSEYPLRRLYRYADILVSLGILALTGALALQAMLRREKARFSLLFLSLPLIFIFFKEAYTRFGGGAPVFYRVALVLLVPALFQALKLGPRLSEVLPTAALCLVALMALGLAGRVYPGLDWGMPQVQTLQTRLQTYEEAVGLIQDRQAAQWLQDETRARYRAGYQDMQPLLGQVGSSSVDIYPFEHLAAYAYDLNWTPHPVLQSYSAYTHRLDQADADFYSGSQAPEYVVFAVDTIDGRNALFDEPAAVRALLERYRPVQRSGPYLLLRHRTDVTAPRPIRRLESIRVPLGADVLVPASPGRVYADIDVRYSLFGQVLRSVFQPSIAEIWFGYEDGTISRPYRLVTTTARDGVLVSGHVDNAEQFAQVIEGGNPQPIRSLRVAPRRAPDFEPTMSVTFYTDG